MRRIAILLAVVAFFCCARTTVAAQSVDWKPLVDRLVADGFDRSQLQQLFAGIAYDPKAMGHKMLTLYNKKYGSGLVRRIQSQLDRLGYAPGKADGYAGSKTRAAIRGFQANNGLEVNGQVSESLLEYAVNQGRKAPAGYTPPPKPESHGASVWRSVLTEERMAEAREFYKTHTKLLQKVEDEYGIPPEIAVGLLAVETRVGNFLGDQAAFATLASMARSTTPETFLQTFKYDTPQGAQLTWLRKRTRQKADWAYDELKALLVYSKNKGADPRTLPCSIYGAIGICQFMPSNALRFGVDGDNDGVVNLFDVDDALPSMGNYLKRHGWSNPGASVRKQRKALYNYNHSVVYVNTIMAVAERLKEDK